MAAAAHRDSEELVFCEDGLAVGQVGPMCTVLWREGVTDWRFSAQVEGLRTVAERCPEGFAFICIVEPTAHPPNERLRRASLEMLESHGERLKCIALVVEGSGFGAAMVRSALTGMALLWRDKPAPVEFFADPASALEWASEHVGRASPQAFARLLHLMRTRLAPYDTARAP